MPEKEALIRLYEEPAHAATCRGCGAAIRWHETLGGKKMPMNADAVPRRSENDLTGRVVAFYAQAESHWSTCPNREEFRR